MTPKNKDELSPLETAKEILSEIAMESPLKCDQNLIALCKAFIAQAAEIENDNKAREIFLRVIDRKDEELKSARECIEFYGESKNWESGMSDGRLVEIFKPVKTFGNEKAQAWLARESMQKCLGKGGVAS